MKTIIKDGLIYFTIAIFVFILVTSTMIIIKSDYRFKINYDKIEKTWPKLVDQYDKMVKTECFYGIQCDVDSLGRYGWYIKCPCDCTVFYPLNGLPTKDTPHPCGNPNHWTIKFEKFR